MNYGDGWYGGVYVGAMYTLAFVSDDIEYIVTEALKQFHNRVYIISVLMMLFNGIGNILMTGSRLGWNVKRNIVKTRLALKVSLFHLILMPRLIALIL